MLITQYEIKKALFTSETALFTSIFTSPLRSFNERDVGEPGRIAVELRYGQLADDQDRAAYIWSSAIPGARSRKADLFRDVGGLNRRREQRRHRRRYVTAGIDLEVQPRRRAVLHCRGNIGLNRRDVRVVPAVGR